MKERGEMTYEERLEAAERHRLRGNALFQEACALLLSSRILHALALTHPSMQTGSRG